MDSLFGVPLVSIMVGLLLLMGLAFAVFGWIAWRNPLFVRMGLRNIRRRRAQTVLIVVGLMLSTLIVSAAFATGNTVGYSITNQIYNQLEEVDFIVAFRDDVSQLNRPSSFSEAAFLTQLREQFAQDKDIDGITGAVTRVLPVLDPHTRLSDPSVRAVGVDPATIDSFKGLRTAKSGNLVSAAGLSGDNVYITERLAKKIDAGAGDTVQIFFANKPNDFHVVDVVRDTSVTSQGNATSGGLVMSLDRMWALTGQPGRLSTIAVSLRGGTRDTLPLIDPVQTRLEKFLEQHPEAGARIATTKADLVKIGELAGSLFVTFFLVFGLFSMAAGILLIFLIFVMLAAERRSEMGMARAIGMSRLHLTETFIAEGMAYNVGAAMVGALLGLGVSFLLIFALGRIFSGFGLAIVFHPDPRGFVISYAAGVVVTFATVAFASWRAANLNIVRAIRDLPEPALFRTARPTIPLLLRSAVGALWYVMWIVLIGIAGFAAFSLFLLSLGLYGLPFLVIIPVLALYVYGVRVLTRPWSATSGFRRRGLFVLWCLVFNVVALVTWILLKTRGWANRYRSGGGWALLMLVVGLVFVYLGGWRWGQAFAYTGGTTLAVLAIAMLAVYFGGAPRAAFTTAGLVLVWYWLLPLPFSLFLNDGQGLNDPIDGLFKLLSLPRPLEIAGQIEMFFVSGVSITSAATLVVIFNAGALLSVLTLVGRALGGLVPAIRTAIAYPLAARFRTAMTLSMFGLVVFSLIVMAFLNYNFSQLFLGDEARVGFDIHASDNPDNRVPDLRAALQPTDAGALDQIAGLGTTTASTPFAQQAQATAKAQRQRVIGGDADFYRLAKLPLNQRAAGYSSDAAVWAAVQSDPTLVVASDETLKRPAGGFGGGGDSGNDRFEFSYTLKDLEAGPWQPIAVSLRDPDSGVARDVKVIGFLRPQVTGVLGQLAGLYSTRDAVSQLSKGGRMRDDFYITARDTSQDATEREAKRIAAALLERGVQADSISSLIEDQTTQSSAFSALFQGFMGLGLIVGIAALGVIAFRTVVERRQQIGMLRAIGYSRRLVGFSFFLESSFIAVTGILMGLTLGWALAYNLLHSPAFVGQSGNTIDFRVPWVHVLIITGVAYGASALMTLIPARSASRVAVAEALRYE